MKHFKLGIIFFLLSLFCIPAFANVTIIFKKFSPGSHAEPLEVYALLNNGTWVEWPSINNGPNLVSYGDKVEFSMNAIPGKKIEVISIKTYMGVHFTPDRPIADNTTLTCTFRREYVGRFVLVPNGCK